MIEFNKKTIGTEIDSLDILKQIRTIKLMARPFRYIDVISIKLPFVL